MLTGAFLPESFKNSDADFNIGLAIGNRTSMKKINYFYPITMQHDF